MHSHAGAWERGKRAQQTTLLTVTSPKLLLIKCSSYRYAFPCRSVGTRECVHLIQTVIVHQCLIFVRFGLRSVLPVREKAETGEDEVLVNDYAYSFNFSATSSLINFSGSAMPSAEMVILPDNFLFSRIIRPYSAAFNNFPHITSIPSTVLGFRERQ